VEGAFAGDWKTWIVNPRQAGLSPLSIDTYSTCSPLHPVNGRPARESYMAKHQCSYLKKAQ